MLDPNLLRERPEEVTAMLKARGMDLSLEALTSLDARKRKLQAEIDALRSERNTRSKEIGKLKSQGQDISGVSTDVQKLGEKLKALEAEYTEVQTKFDHDVLFLPNLPLASVPIGKTADDNRVERSWGSQPTFSFKPKEHDALGEALGILDFERGTKISGARFTLYRKAGALLERALINFMLDVHTREHGYEEVLPPFMVSRRSITTTGNLPKFIDDVFHIEKHDFFLIPTAEVPVTNIHFDEILKPEDLPRAYVAYTPCFRSEAGSYGKDTKGLIRQHQFNKVELVRFSHPEKSEAEHELLTRHAEAILQKLNLPYRVMTLCTGDMGFSSCKTYDLEVWLPGQNAYREISSCSNFGDFQARRGKIRFRGPDGKPHLVHTLNGSGLAVGRTLVAILENFQNADGSVDIPEVLRPYMHGLSRLEAGH